MTSSSLLVFAPQKLLSEGILFTNARVVAVVFAHQVLLSVGTPNQELARLPTHCDGTRMLIPQTALPASNSLWEGGFSHT